MRNHLRYGPARVTSAVLGGALAVAMAWPLAAAPVTQARLENTAKEPQNWLLGYGNYQGHMFSSLNQVNRSNVANLKMAIMLPIASALAGNPALNLMNHGLVDDGFLYFDDGRGGIYKVDLTSGDSANVVWKADAAVTADESNRTRGIAFFENSVFHNLTDGRVVAINRDTGEFIWDKQIARTDHPKGSGVNIKAEYFDAAPLPVNGKILVGNSYADGLTRGWLAAIDAATGNETWRTYMVPGPGEPGHETWKDKTEVWRIGGAGLWTTGTYDPETKLTYWGTGNAQPMYDPEYRPGDNLYAGSVVAMDVADGKIKWYFQYTPNEGWDYDENGVHQIYYNVPVAGTPRKLIGHWGRNGFYYRLDAATGQFLDASQYVAKVDWTKGIDPKTGKPVEYDPAKAVQTYLPATRPARGKGPTTFCPTAAGGVRWQSVAYNPTKFVAYSAALDGCSSRNTAEARPLPGTAMLDTKAPGGIRGNAASLNIGFKGLVRSVDVRTNKMLATHSAPYESLSGALATAGGLVFTAFTDGRIVALNDDTLEEMWHFNSNVTTKAPVFTFSVKGKQFVAIIAGGGRAGSDYTASWPEAKNWVNGPVMLMFSL